MRITAFAIAALLAAETALACVCLPVDDPEQRREAAQRILSESSAIAVVEQVQPTDDDSTQPELYSVLKVHSGSVPSTFRLAQQIERTPTGNIVIATSCDVVPPPGEPTLVVLYPSDTAGAYRIGGTCDHLFVNSPGAVDLIREQAGKLERPGERG